MYNIYLRLQVIRQQLWKKGCSTRRTAMGKRVAGRKAATSEKGLQARKEQLCEQLWK
jgi:hypothetical protein